MSQNTVKQHYFLASTRIHFNKEVNGDTEYGTMDMNVVLYRSKKNVSVAGLAKIQQMAQVLFHERVQIKEVDIVDVFILGISYLGNMSEKEFNTVEVGEPAPSSQGNNQKTDLLAGAMSRE